MLETAHQKFLLPDRTYQAIVRSEIRKIAQSIGFSEHRLGEVEIVVAEMTTNLVKHSSKGGMLLVRVMEEVGMELICIDDGPGMATPLRMLEDGQSTTKTLGQGLGAIKRLANEFDLYSMPNWGTIVFTRILQQKSTAIGQKNQFGVDGLLVAKNGEQYCGDAWRVRQNGKKIRFTLMDGLGHGPEAFKTVQEAYKLFGKDFHLNPVEQLRELHLALRKLRGMVATVVHLDLTNRQIQYAGVGNIGMKLVTPLGTKGGVSYNGIVGHIMPTVLNTQKLSFNENLDWVILFSDGIRSRWELSQYPNIQQHHSMILCAALYKDHQRGNDDASIVVARRKKQ